MSTIHIDFETRSPVDLKNATTHIYATHPETDVHCMAYAIDDGPVWFWKRGEPFPYDIAVEMDDLEVKFVAHNAHFELHIWNEICHKRYGWPPLKPEQTYCTMAMAYAMALPGSLENAAGALGLDVRKDIDGRKLMLKMAAPINSETPWRWREAPADLERLYEYCKNDVVVERELEKRLLPLRPRERKLWLLDWKINNHGIYVDVPSIEAGMKTIEAEKLRLSADIHKATAGQVSGATDVQGLTNMLAVHGLYSDSGVFGVAKADLRKALSMNLLPEMRDALLIRQEAAKSSTAKLKAMRLAASPDRRVRGTIQYHGATTGRFAGRKIQPHNFPRPDPEMTPERIEAAIPYLGSADMLSLLYGPPMRIVSDCLRAMICAAPGNELMCMDLSAIEARVLAWLAGQENILDVFREGLDVYKVAAASIYNTPYENVDEEQRQVGKVAVLALGFGGGVGAFQTMARGYNIDMTPAYAPLREAASDAQISRAHGLYERYIKKEKGDPISYEVFMASDLTKQLWREANPEIVLYWRSLEGAAKAAVATPGSIHQVGPRQPHRRVTFKKQGSFLWMKLPSGRALCYPYPEIRETLPPWEDEGSDNTRPTLTYMTVDSTTKTWRRMKSYGGLIAENATQAAARDFLVEGLFRLDDAHYPIAFHVHDDVTVEVQKNFGSLEEMKNLLTTPPDWGFDCPVAAKGWRGQRYRK